MDNKISNRMNYLKKNLLNIFFIAFLLFLPVISLAQVTGDAPKSSSSSGGFRIENPIKASTFSGLIKTVLEGVVKIGMPFLVLAIIYCGFLFVEAQGNTEKIGKAKDALMYTLVGAAILLGSWAIAQLIVDTVKAL